MKKILLTGASGFVGSNILPFLLKRYHVYTPGRSELDVRDSEQVSKYIENGDFDVVIHLASPSPIRSGSLDSYENLFEDILRIFMNFYSNRKSFGKMIYSGSGAEFDKRRDLSQISEEEIGISVPVDSYGLSKYYMNELARNSDNIYNLRIFACFGPNEYDSKFIRHAIQCCLAKKPITIRQDCYFDYLYVDDYARYLLFCIENQLQYHDYNAVSGHRIKLSKIAEIVAQQMGNQLLPDILSEGMNKEYSASNKRIQNESGIMDLISIESGVAKLIEWEKKNYEAKSC